MRKRDDVPGLRQAQTCLMVVRTLLHMDEQNIENSQLDAQRRDMLNILKFVLKRAIEHYNNQEAEKAHADMLVAKHGYEACRRDMQLPEIGRLGDLQQPISLPAPINHNQLIVNNEAAQQKTYLQAMLHFIHASIYTPVVNGAYQVYLSLTSLAAKVYDALNYIWQTAKPVPKEEVRAMETQLSNALVIDHSPNAPAPSVPTLVELVSGERRAIFNEPVPHEIWYREMEKNVLLALKNLEKLGLDDTERYQLLAIRQTLKRLRIHGYNSPQCTRIKEDIDSAVKSLESWSSINISPTAEQIADQSPEIRKFKKLLARQDNEPPGILRHVTARQERREVPQYKKPSPGRKVTFKD